MRLDQFISLQYKDITRSQAKRLVETDNVIVNGVICHKPSHEIKEGDKVEVNIPEPKMTKTEPEEIVLEILYEDADIIVINKSAGMVVHPAAGNLRGTLVNALLHHCKDLSGIGGELRPGIVHRLDKGTSGVMVVAKNDSAHQNLSAQFKSRTVEKRYYALLFGKVPTESGVINIPIGRHVSDRKKMSVKTSRGRTAETHYNVIDRTGSELTFVDVRLATGRTHQIRVHFSHMGHPLIGDDLYGSKAIKRLKNKELIDIVKSLSRPFLHAYKLVINHPKNGKQMVFTAKLPGDLTEVLNGLHKIKLD